MPAEKKLLSSTALERPGFYEVFADATHQGKTTFSKRLKDHLLDGGIDVILVRVESNRVVAETRDDAILIPTENFALAEQLPGGVVGVLAPVFERIPNLKAGQALILDWAGGCGEHRLEAWAAAGIGEALAENGVAAMSFYITINVPDRMVEIREALAMSAQIAPELPRVLVLNERLGGFASIGRSKGAEAFKALMHEHGDRPVLKIPRIKGESFAHLQPLGMAMRDMVTLDHRQLAKTLHSQEFLVKACVSYIGAWYKKTREELLRALPFRPA
jgi:hypothetical protein